ncbi:germin-like protein subfamily 2 member 4 [Silene latifolia]|uniref:germin-like protein subfamily 2 member 4 n=1 Tax=Silene latifolia TaxID=37657 RepID=UPI003D76B373
MAEIRAILMVLLAITIGVFANDADMLQDVCVADLASTTLVNGFVCKNSTLASAEDFFFGGIAQPLPITNKVLNSIVTNVNVEKVPGLNTLGVSMARIDYGPGGLNPPHIHPRATEIIFVLTGQLKVGFITTKNVLISKTLNAGEVFVFPRGLVHFQKNPSKSYPASVIAGFNSQLPGTQQFAASLFTAKPPVPNDVLAQAFNIDSYLVDNIRAGLTPKA